MTYLRWLHKSWNYFWTFLGVLILTLVLISSIVFGVMQLPSVKQMLASEIEERFNDQFNGVLSIGKIRGMVPLLVTLDEVKIYADSSKYDPVLQVSQISANLDLISLLKNQFVINGIYLSRPELVINRNSAESIHSALTAAEKSAGDIDNFIETLALQQILIPSVQIDDGKITFSDPPPFFQNELADSITVSNVNLSMFFEFTEEQRFIDITRLDFRIAEFNIDKGSITGQVYNDDRFLELNAFRVFVDDSRIRFSGEADGVNLLQGNVPQQLVSSEMRASFEEMLFDVNMIQPFFPDHIELPEMLLLSVNADGTLDSLNFQNLEISTGESYLFGDGYLKNILEPKQIYYSLNIDGSVFDTSLVDIISTDLALNHRQALAEIHLSGSIEGHLKQVNTDLTIASPKGQIALNGEIELTESPSVDINFRTDSLDIGGLTGLGIQQSNLSVEGSIKSTSMNVTESKGGLAITGRHGNIDQIQFDNLSVLASWEDGFIEPDIDLILNGSSIKTLGWIDLKQSQYEYSLSGSAANFEIHDWFNIPKMAPAKMDMQFDVHLKGNSMDELSGQLSLDIPTAIVNGDSLDHHQFYFDFNDPESATRSFRFTSTAFDATLEGNYKPSNILQLTEHWHSFFKNRIQSDFLASDKVAADTSHLILPSENLSVTARLKNTDLIHSYFPDFPQITSSTRLNSAINIGSERLLFNGTWQDPQFKIGEQRIDSLLVQITGNFRYDEKLQEFSRLQLQAEAAAFELGFLDAKNIVFYAELDRDSIYIRNNMDEFAGNSNFAIETTGNISDQSLALFIDEFSYGEDEYTWHHHDGASLTYMFDAKLQFNNFGFSNLDQFISINGTLSNDLSDSVNYEIGGIDLSRVSRIIDGRIPFNGELNGIFTSRTLSTVPAIQGDIFVEQFEIDGNTVGDINIISRYNNDLDRFDTEIGITTDSTKYPNYFTNTGRRGQEFEIHGYVIAPKDGEFPDTDSLFVFDMDFNNIDMWILPYIAPKIFNEGSGLAQGTGKIWGNLEDYDFRADFMVGTEAAAFLRPRFLDTYYYAQGPITFTRQNGLEFHDIFLVDPSGGTAILSGYYDFNDFQPLNFMNITLAMDEFQFLNSTFDPTAPFYGTVYGSSTVTISGTNLKPVLSTLTPIIISDFSEIGIPLLDETEFTEDNRFIRFVDSFDLSLDSAQNVNANSGDLNNLNVLDPEDLTFAERFTIDLQLEARNPMTVQLIFDPVTGDIVTAAGTGRMRIRLEDEQVSMFGRFDITGGRYQFVSGDIFSRRFELESGGSILWEGDPANARLNLNAFYRARPDINTLTTVRSDINPENAQRVPVELVLNIGGTISSIENNFYFRLPATFEARQSSTLATQLAALNRDEELKLIQSANFLLMGDFIPISSTSETLFADNISGSGAVLNPLLSSQVISPLLSNQINSLLNTDLSTLDVDFNLNTYNQVDLGVALRLYNDRLILRREGQITGQQSNIGDLGATYRINRTFAVTAFHRQDLTIGTLNTAEQSQQGQEINGVGIEANVSFNNWKEFIRRLTLPFRKLFGVVDEEQENLTENRQG